MPFEPWRANFLIDLYENTKESVEIAEKHYLQSLIATSMKREIKEFHDRYGSFASRTEANSLRDKLDELDVLDKEVQEAMIELKKRSDEYYRISSHGYAFKVERMTYDECKMAELPNFSKFLSDWGTLSFGPLSEKWDDLKGRIEEDFVGILSRSSAQSSSTSLREDCSGESNLSVWEAEESEMNRSNPSLSPEEGVEEGDDGGDQVGEMEKNENLDDDKMVKPEVKARKHNRFSMNRPLSTISQRILLESAKVADRRRKESYGSNAPINASYIVRNEECVLRITEKRTVKVLVLNSGNWKSTCPFCQIEKCIEKECMFEFVCKFLLEEIKSPKDKF